MTGRCIVFYLPDILVPFHSFKPIPPTQFRVNLKYSHLTLTHILSPSTAPSPQQPTTPPPPPSSASPQLFPTHPTARSAPPPHAPSPPHPPDSAAPSRCHPPHTGPAHSPADARRCARRPFREATGRQDRAAASSGQCARARRTWSSGLGLRSRRAAGC